MRIRNGLVPLSMFVLFSTVNATNVAAQDAGDDGGVTVIAGLDAGPAFELDASAPEAGVHDDAGRADAGDGGPYKVWGGEDNDELVDEYHDQHGCTCSMAGRHGLSGGVPALAFVGFLLARARRMRRRARVSS